MNQRRLKSLGVSVPQVALGTVELGLPYGFGLDGETSQPSFQQAERLIHAALDHGLRFIDTARAYGDSEEILGRCLHNRRADLILTTKVGPLHLDGRTDAEIAAAINESVEQSLRLLRTDHVDWLMLHSATLAHVRQLPRLLEPIEALRRQGKFRAFGASIYDDALDLSLETPAFYCLQTAASVIDRRFESRRPQHGAGNKDFIFRSVLLRGALTEKYRSLPDSMEPLRFVVGQLDRLAADAGISLTELAYRYAAGADGLILVGTASIAELDQTLAFVERGPLSPDLLNQIRSLASLEDQYLNPAKWPQHAPQPATKTA